jgi:hypothetical protein
MDERRRYKVKKIITFTLIALISFIFVACDNGGTTTTVESTTAQTTTTATTTEATTTEATTTENTTTEYVDPCSIDPFAPECITTDNIVLSYADWADIELTQALANSFMEKYPNITVDVRQDITGSLLKQVDYYQTYLQLIMFLQVLIMVCY